MSVSLAIGSLYVWSVRACRAEHQAGSEGVPRTHIRTLYNYCSFSSRRDDRSVSMMISYSNTSFSTLECDEHFCAVRLTGIAHFS